MTYAVRIVAVADVLTALVVCVQVEAQTQEIDAPAVAIHPAQVELRVRVALFRRTVPCGLRRHD